MAGRAHRCPRVALLALATLVATGCGAPPASGSGAGIAAGDADTASDVATGNDAAGVFEDAPSEPDTATGEDADPDDGVVASDTGSGPDDGPSEEMQDGRTADATPADGAVASDVSDVSDVPDVSDVSDVSDVVDGDEDSDAADVAADVTADVAAITDAGDAGAAATDAEDVSVVSDVPDVPDAVDAVDANQAPEVDMGPVPDVGFGFQATVFGKTSAWSVVGLLDLAGNGVLRAVLIGGGEVAVYALPGSEPKASAPLPTLLQTVKITPDASYVAAAAADYDGNGTLDLIVISGTHGQLLTNTGGVLQAQPAIALPQSNDELNAMAATVIDANGDGKPEFIGGRSINGGADDFVADGCKLGGDGSLQCGLPGKVYPGGANVMLRVAPGGQLEAVPAFVDTAVQQTQGLMAIDLDGDGDEDLVICDDAAKVSTRRNNGTDAMEPGPAAWGIHARLHCMGIAADDLDGDGHPDLAFQGIAAPAVLWGGIAGWEETKSAGLDKLAWWGWGNESVDLDNDGTIELTATSQIIPPSMWAYVCPNCGIGDRPTHELAIWKTNGTRVFEVKDAIVAKDQSAFQQAASVGGSAMVVADFDGDGVVDGLLLRRQPKGLAESWLLRGVAAAGNHGIDVAAPRGARVVACTSSGCQSRLVTGGGSFNALRPLRAHFGLGKATSAVVTIEHPKGGVTPLGTVKAMGAP